MKIKNVYLKTSRKYPVLEFRYDNGASRNKTLHCDLETAKRIHQQILNELALGELRLEKYLPFRRPKITLREFIAKYIEHREGEVKRRRISPETLRTDISSLNQFKKIIGGNYPVNAVDKKTIDRFVDYFLNNTSQYGRKYSFYYVNLLLRTISSAFTWAAEMRYVEKNPFLKYRKLPESESPKKRRALTTEEIRRLVNETRGWVNDAVKLMLSTGMRPGALLTIYKDSLKAEIIDGELFYFLEIKEKGKKGAKRNHIVPLNSTALEIICRRIDLVDNPAEVEKYVKERYDFNWKKQLKPHLERAARGQLFFEISRRDALSKAFARERQRLGLDKAIDLHSLSHTFATRALDNNIHIKVLSALLGHESVTTTEIYSKASLAAMVRAIQQIKL